MSDLSGNFLPYASLIAGLSGSLHCLGMCGGLVTASCSGGKDVFKYQLGRLIGYSLMGSVAWLLGYTVKGILPFHWAPVLSGLFMGALFIYWGIKNFQGKKAELPLPVFIRMFYQYAFRNYVSKAGAFRSFSVGLISIMLPCGLIYGLILSALALGTYEQVMISLFFFWLGTLPAMIGAPQLIKKLLAPFRRSLPKVYAVFFIIIGVATIAGRLSYSYPEQINRKSSESAHHCH